MPKFSVVIPIYKVEQYLNAGIEGVLAQTYTDYEIILVDDGSPDNCPAICDEWAKKDSRIKVIHKENGGLSSARNAGMDEAQGEFVYFCDPDDKIAPNLLELCAERLKRDNSDAVRFGLQMFRNGKLVDENTVIFQNSVEKCESGKEKIDFIKRQLFSNTMWSACTCIYSLKVIKENNLRFADNKKIYAEDLYFACLFTLYANKISLHGEPLYYYIRREDSIMGQSQSIVKLNEINFLSYTLYKYVRDDYLIKKYHELHHMIIMNQVARLPKLTKYKYVKAYDEAIDSIKQKDFFVEQMKKHHKFAKQTRKIKGFYYGWHQNMVNRYMIRNNKFVLFINLMLWKLAFFPYKMIKILLGKK